MSYILTKQVLYTLQLYIQQMSEIINTPINILPF